MKTANDPDAIGHDTDESVDAAPRGLREMARNDDSLDADGSEWSSGQPLRDADER